MWWSKQPQHGMEVLAAVLGLQIQQKLCLLFVCSFCMLLAQLVCTGAVSVMACTVLKRCGGTDTWERWYVCTSLTVVDSECLKINSS